MTDKEQQKTTDVLKNSIESIRKGEVESGRQGLIWILQKDHTNVLAWLWLAYITEDLKKKLDYYQYVLTIDPANETARKAIAKYGGLQSVTDKIEVHKVGTVRHATLSDLGYIENQSDETSTINSRLNQARKDLLDLSLFNRLLNYRPLKSKGLEIVDEKPVEVFRILVREGHQMSFLPVQKKDPQLKQEALLNGTPDLNEYSLAQPEDEDDQYPDRHIDNKLQTSYTSEVLQNRLLNTYYAARIYVQEQGVNILYLAIGMLHWYESPSSNEVRIAPLILVPVELTRSNVRSKFHIHFTEEDIGENLSLRAKLLVDFGIKLPDFPEDEELDVESYLGMVGSVVRSMPRWQVDYETIALGFFSFGKFLMFHDLESELWPDDLQPAEHPILNSLLGNGFERDMDLLADNANADDHLSLEGTHHVLDADSSQSIAILEAGRGCNLVIQGPPGTGKSQTITNLVAEAVANGKTVLFVAEKMAALDVVKRRLDQVGLGESCLELHSQKSNKKILLTELKRILDLGEPRLGEPIDLADLKRNRDRLNEYSRAVNEEIRDTSLTPYEIYGKLLILKDVLADAEPPAMDIPGIETWFHDRIQRARSTIEELHVLIQGIGRPVDHLFWGCKITRLLPLNQEYILNCLRAAISALSALGEEDAKITGAMLQPSSTSQEEVRKVLAILKYLLSAPSVSGVNIESEVWIVDAIKLEEVVEIGRRLTGLRNLYQPILRHEAWIQDVSPLKASLQQFIPKWWRVLSPEYHTLCDQVKDLCQSPYSKSIKKQLALLDAILDAQNLVSNLQTFDSTGSKLFGEGWKGELSDWKWIHETSIWLRTFHEAIQNGGLSQTILDFLALSPDFNSLKDHNSRLEYLLSESNRCLEEVVAALHLHETIRFGEGRSLACLPFSEQAHLLCKWSEEINRLYEMTTLLELLRQLEELDLSILINPTLEWSEAAHHLVDLFDHTWLTALLQRAFLDRPALARFNGDMHSHYTRQFCNLDLAMILQNRILLAHQHWEALPRQEPRGQLKVLYREFAKKKRNKPIRILMSEAGKAIQVLKPIFMMSPLSVAMYLPPNSVDFDIVVFDEASQVKPVDAFGSILRGHQLVVVGDDHQLPPTTFFETSIDVDDDYSESVTADLESILGLCVSQGISQRMLNWHYRSQHESLITVSNYEFYDNKLTVFPSPEKDKRTVGLVYHCLPHTEYGRGGSRKNIAEAKVVAEAVMAHAKNSPGLSLGVAAFSVSQMEAVRDQLEILRRQDPSCETFFRSHREEPFFIKNLENVQGDERDVVFISVGYGRTAEGTISMSFGPLNADGGERRLNVLITRSRKRCEIFTNLSTDDIDLSRTNARGVQVLKRFLKYAETGSLDLPTPSERESGSAFEEAVASRLRGLGYRVDYQVGTGGFFIDLAVIDDDVPGRYLLGIECDGATYHSARSARDRDRLRQEILEALGWKIHRIWSTDWFRNPNLEISRLQSAINDSQSSRKAPSSHVEIPLYEPVSVEIPRGIPQSRGLKLAIEVESYSMARLMIHGYRDNLHETPSKLMASWIQQVVSVESPVHEDEVLRRIVEDAGVHRIGNRIESTFRSGIRSAAQGGLVNRKGKFLWDPNMSEPHIRSRSSLPNSSRRIELIAPEEISLAAIRITESAYSISKQELAKSVREIFGFTRATEGMLALIFGVISQMLADGSLISKGNYLSVPEKV